ncbi:MAG: AAA family ATPase [Chloroflexota bacterium]|nr:AAA family ATPase [Chloroflexota bacterium]MDE2897825.1 AAA family ATPase [Chloroflexota bacterium]
MIDGLPKRVWVCGLSGSGKTTVARRLAAILGVPHVELDALHWRHHPEWGMPSDEEFLPAVREATAGDAWVVEGNYSRSRDIFWPRVELMVWLDLPLRTACWRVFARTLRRIRSKDQLLWGVQRETVRNALLTWDGLVLWNLRVYRRRHRTYTGLMRDANARGTDAVRLRSQRAVDAWLDDFERPVGPKPQT